MASSLSPLCIVQGLNLPMHMNTCSTINGNILLASTRPLDLGRDHDVLEPNLGPFFNTQWSQATKHPVVVKESAAFVIRHHRKRMGGSKTPNSQKGFWKAFLKATLREWHGGEGLVRLVISLCTILWLANGEITGRCHMGQHYWSLGSSKPGRLHAHDHQVVNSFIWWKV